MMQEAKIKLAINLSSSTAYLVRGWTQLSNDDGSTATGPEAVIKVSLAV